MVIFASVFLSSVSRGFSGFSISLGETQQEDPLPGRHGQREFLVRFEVFAKNQLLGG